MLYKIMVEEKDGTWREHQRAPFASPGEAHKACVALQQATGAQHAAEAVTGPALALRARTGTLMRRWPLASGMLLGGALVEIANLAMHWHHLWS